MCPVSVYILLLCFQMENYKNWSMVLLNASFEKRLLGAPPIESIESIESNESIAFYALASAHPVQCKPTMPQDIEIIMNSPSNNSLGASSFCSG